LAAVTAEGSGERVGKRTARILERELCCGKKEERKYPVLPRGEGQARPGGRGVRRKFF